MKEQFNKFEANAGSANFDDKIEMLNDALKQFGFALPPTFRSTTIWSSINPRRSALPPRVRWTTRRPSTSWKTWLSERRA